MIRRVARLFAAFAGCFGISLGASGLMPSATAVAQNTDYRSADRAPAVWREYARWVQNQFQDRLAADDNAVHEVKRMLSARTTGDRGLAVVAKVWISAKGRIDRLELDGLDDDTSRRLRAVLTRDHLGPPPPDMLQPLRLKLALGQPG